MFLIVACLFVVGYGFGFATAVYKWFPYQLIAETRQWSQEGDRSSYYQRKIDIYEQCGSTADVVMIGDSITDCGEWHELFPSISIANRGISGDQAVYLGERMASVYSTGARKAFILIGVNDLQSGAQVDHVFDAYKHVVDELLARQIAPYVQSTLKTRRQADTLNDKIADLNERLEKLADELDIVFIDLNKVFAPQGELLEEYTSDGIHLNGRGYFQWKGLLEPYLTP